MQGCPCAPSGTARGRGACMACGASDWACHAPAPSPGTGAAVAASLAAMLALAAAGSQAVFGRDIRDDALSNFSFNCIRWRAAQRLTRATGCAVCERLRVRCPALALPPAGASCQTSTPSWQRCWRTGCELPTSSSPLPPPHSRQALRRLQAQASAPAMHSCGGGRPRCDPSVFLPAPAGGAAV